MAKVRLHLGKIKDGWSSSTSILCKKIHTIIMDDKTYHRKDYIGDSKKIQNFYRTIIKTPDKITYIKHGNFDGDDFTEYIEMYLKDNKLHSITGPAQITKSIKNTFEDKRYYIDGKNYDFYKWEKDPKRINVIREIKLKRILKQTKTE